MAMGTKELACDIQDPKTDYVDGTKKSQLSLHLEVSCSILAMIHLSLSIGETQADVAKCQKLSIIATRDWLQVQIKIFLMERQFFNTSSNAHSISKWDEIMGNIFIPEFDKTFP